MSAEDAYSVVVVGGGPAGSAAALALAGAGRRVLLVDASSAPAFRVGEALAPAAMPLLRDLGVLARFREEGHLPCYGNVSVWGSDAPIATDFLAHPWGHGWHLDRSRFDGRLREAAAEAGAVVRSGARVSGVVRGGGGWRVRGRDAEGRPWEARGAWLIDATGRRGAVARRLGATRLRADRLVAFHSRFVPTDAGEDRDSRTAVEAVPDGWWYAARVPSGERVVAFLTDADLASRSGCRSVAGFQERLAETRYIGTLVGRGYRLEGRPRGADAGSARLERFAGPGWLAVGEAALAFDPLSSQGLFTALYTGLRAGQALDRVLSGDSRTLYDYLYRLEEVYDAYLQHRAVYYRAEGRWADRPFWARRVARSFQNGPEIYASL